MILPQDFKNFVVYFDELVLFLKKYSWLYEVAVTNLLTFDIFSKIPEEWIPHLLDLNNDELNNVPTGLIKDDWPSSLKQFSQDCRRFTLPVLAYSEPLHKPYDLNSWLQLVPREIWRGMSPKKKDEVEIMLAFVHNECKERGINKILDLGSGLGYIDRLLLLRGYRILGIESQVKLVSFATIQKENFFPPLVANNLSYHQMTVSGHTISEIRDIIIDGLFKTNTLSVKNTPKQKKNENVNKYDWEKFIPICKDVLADANSEKVCLIGLHTCGDLAVTGMKMFLTLPEVSAFVLVPCCYHKMAVRQFCSHQGESETTVECDKYNKICETNNDTCTETFKNFPLSEALARLSVGAKFVCKSFLRLANQATNSGWQGWTEEDHQRHAFNVLSRAVIELFAQQQGTSFKKCFRRVVKKTSLKGKDFASYIDESLSRCEFVNENHAFKFEKNKDKIRHDLLDMWEQQQTKLRLSEVVTALQMCLEPVAESLVVADRACYLKENGADSVRVVRIIDNKLSPRCLAYIASKK